jgi:outer membrane protein assembly factor BamB
MMKLTSTFLAAATLALSTTYPSLADDWPQWRGPQRDGISHETGLLKEWPKDGPKLLWQVKDIGRGYSTPSVVSDKLYLLANEGLDNEFVEALSVKDGKRLWSTRLGKVGSPDQQPNFPAARSTPTVDGKVLYALGSDGDLACLETDSGKVIWRKNLSTDFHGKVCTWAYAESPLIDGETLVCTPGGKEATLVALNKKTGEVIWKSAVPGGDEAEYASVVTAEVDGNKQYVQLLQNGVVGVDAKTGKFLWRNPKIRGPYNASIPTPVAYQNYVYGAAAGGGGGLVKLKAKDGGCEAEQVYFSAKMPTAIGGAVKVGNFLYGCTGQALLCLEFTTGGIKWQERSIAPASLCCADGRLYLHSEEGDVALVEATADGYHEKGRFTPPDQPKRINEMEKAWAYPAVANGRLYIRDHDRLWCYDVKGG